MKYRLFWFDANSDAIDNFLTDNDISMTEYEYCPLINEISKFNCVTFTDEFAIILKIKFPKIILYEVAPDR